MTALVKDTTHFQPAAAQRETGDLARAARVTVGFVAAPAAKQADQLRRAILTMLLVLYPAMATAAVVIAALVFSGAQPIV